MTSRKDRRVPISWVVRRSFPPPVLHRMRELWNYLQERFEETERPLKAIRKANDLAAYETAAKEILRNCPMK